MALKKTFTADGKTGEYWTIKGLAHLDNPERTVFWLALYENEAASKRSDESGKRVGLDDFLILVQPFMWSSKMERPAIYARLKQEKTVACITTMRKAEVRDKDGNVVTPAVAEKRQNLPEKFFADAEDLTAQPLPAIPNVNPPRLGAFNRWWVAQFVIENGESMMAKMLPYDGRYTLSGPEKTISIPDVSADASLVQLVADAQALAQNAAGKAVAPIRVSVDAPAPDRQAKLTALFASDDPNVPESFEIPDIFALAQTDAGAGQVLGGILTWIGAMVSVS